MDIDLRLALGKYLRSTGKYVNNRIGAITDIDADTLVDHDWGDKACFPEFYINIMFEYWDSQHVTHTVLVHSVDQDDLLELLTVIARHK